MTAGWCRISGACGRQRSAGFTLVELLVVISIVGVLITLTIPTLRLARGSSRSVVCRSHLRQLAVLTHCFAQEKGHLPPSFVQPAPQQHWAALLTSQVTGEALQYDTNGLPLGHNLPIFECPAAAAPDIGPGTRRNHYSVHKVLMPSKWNGSGWTGPKKKLDLIQRTHEVILIADGVQSDQPNQVGNAGNAFPTFRRIIPNPVVYYNPSDSDINAPIFELSNTNQDTNANRGHIRYRHGSHHSANVAFVDGHAKVIGRGGILNRNIRINR